MITAPLEQFQILSILPLKLFGLDFSITNFLLINILVLVTIISIIYFNSSYNNCLKDASLYFIANYWQKVLKFVLEISAELFGQQQQLAMIFYTSTSDIIVFLNELVLQSKRILDQLSSLSKRLKFTNLTFICRPYCYFYSYFGLTPKQIYLSFHE